MRPASSQTWLARGDRGGAQAPSPALARGRGGGGPRADRRMQKIETTKTHIMSMGVPLWSNLLWDGEMCWVVCNIGYRRCSCVSMYLVGESSGVESASRQEIATRATESRQERYRRLSAILDYIGGRNRPRKDENRRHIETRRRCSSTRRFEYNTFPRFSLYTPVFCLCCRWSRSKRAVRGGHPLMRRRNRRKRRRVRQNGTANNPRRRFWQPVENYRRFRLSWESFWRVARGRRATATDRGRASYRFFHFSSPCASLRTTQQGGRKVL